MAVNINKTQGLFMKLFSLFVIIFSSVGFLNLSAESTKLASVKDLSSIKQVLTDKSKLDAIDFDHLPEEDTIQVPNLIDEKKESETSFGFNARSVIETPIDQGMSYINGVLCHVGDYPYYSIITPFEGLHYGVQVIVDYSGRILSVNRYYTIEQSIYGVTLTHYYQDYTIITGQDQIIVY